MNDNRQRIYDALHKDFHRHDQETEMFEFFAVTDNLLRARDSVKNWAKPESAPMTLNSLLVRPTIFKEPKVSTVVSNSMQPSDLRGGLVGYCSHNWSVQLSNLLQLPAFSKL